MDKIICVGKNYLEHAKELGDAVPENPVLFLKPPSCLKSLQTTLDQKLAVKLPQGRGSVHPECEIVLRLNQIGQADAVTLGLDMTLRDVQTKLKKQGHPWEVSKVFQDSAVVGPWIPVGDFQSYLEEEFTFSVDGRLRQKGKGKEMRFSVEECIRSAQESFPLCPGDLLFTGTPSGVSGVEAGQVGELKWGDRLRFEVEFR